jgi:hypothetical protein
MHLNSKSPAALKTAILVFFSLLLLTVACSRKKHNGDYTSSEESAYYEADQKANSNWTFQPARLSYIDSLHYDFLTIRESAETNPFKSVRDETPYANYYDSLMRSCMKPNCLDSLVNVQHNDQIAGVFRYSILRYDSLDALKIILFTDRELENRESGYWLAISADSGSSWKKYYTGLVKANFYFIKPIPKVAFIKDASTIQVEFSVVRKTEPEALPVLPATYELVKDNLLMEIDFPRLITDSDNDRLTDIMENKLFLDPNNNDTDGDGIKDNADKNPRYQNHKNKHSVLYHYLLEHSVARDSTFVPFEGLILDPRQTAYRDSISSTYLIVTEDPHLLQVAGTLHRYILMTHEDYEVYAKNNYIILPSLHITPFFQVDNDKDYKKIHISRGMSGSDYVVIETDHGWIVKYIGGYII